ncbi:hypothetical protein QQZ08_009479 [Neonectria magnoliae]|uniref:Uncharacterized protein n=1 Tax=Neonectria magnoliae TaxID=2732573 RepID=A0ABR1HNE5_9HYPO
MKVPRQSNRAGSTAPSSDARTPPVDADLPIPSIEDRDSSTSASGVTSTTSSRSSHLRTPSVSVTPPAPTLCAQSSASDSRRDETTSEARSKSDGVESALQRMRLSSPDGIANLSDVNDAIDAVARGSDSRSMSLAPEGSNTRDESDTPQRKARRRRSSSKAFILPHDVKDEELPQDAFHSPSFQNALRNSKHLMLTTRDVLGSNALHNDPDSTMKRLYVEAGNLACFKYPSTRTVGFVGDSGVEYHYHEKDAFEIKVELFSIDEISDQLSSLLGSYRHFHFNKNEMESSEKKEMEEIAKRARDTFRSMFGDRMENEAFLVENSENKVLRSLISWAADARPSEVRSCVSGSSLKSCSDILMELSSEPDSKTKTAKWPFIRKIK